MSTQQFAKGLDERLILVIMHIENESMSWDSKKCFYHISVKRKRNYFLTFHNELKIKLTGMNSTHVEFAKN